MNIGFDFFLFISFFIPGVFILFSLTLVNATFRTFINDWISGKNNNNWLFAFSLCILLGMMSSIVRNIIIDRTFQWNISFFSENKIYLKPVSRYEPAYAYLTKDQLENLKELKNEEKRPSQFYGNMLIALTFFIVCLISKSLKEKRKKLLGYLCIYVFSFWILYTGSRFSYNNYMSGVNVLNSIIRK